MTQLRSFLRDDRGATIIEFAIALPVLISFIWGIFQIGLVFQAQAGMQHALGEAARLATIFPTPTDDAIRARLAAKKFGTYNGTLGALVIQDNNVTVGTKTFTESKTLTLTYSQPTDFIFINGPTVTMTRSKKVYLAS